MKKFGVIGIVCLLFLLFGCEFQKENYYVILNVDSEKTQNYVLHENKWNSSLNYIEVKLDDEIYLNYFLIPDHNAYVDVISYSSTNPDIITVTGIDTDTKTLVAKAKSVGEAKISLDTKKYGSSTTLKIEVTD
ncbi:MAG: hypothetical protein IJ688_06400 [Treponema sp.]|nr:hypothetical protein [Treponema sp.]